MAHTASKSMRVRIRCSGSRSSRRSTAPLRPRGDVRSPGHPSTRDQVARTVPAVRRKRRSSGQSSNTQCPDPSRSARSAPLRPRRPMGGTSLTSQTWRSRAPTADVWWTRASSWSRAASVSAAARIFRFGKADDRATTHRSPRCAVRRRRGRDSPCRVDRCVANVRLLIGLLVQEARTERVPVGDAGSSAPLGRPG